jgi:hypothetical protein
MFVKKKVFMDFLNTAKLLLTNQRKQRNISAGHPVSLPCFELGTFRI